LHKLTNVIARLDKQLPPLCRRLAQGLALFCAAAGSAFAQTAITSWSLTNSDAPNVTEDGLTYRETTYAVNTFSTSTESYYVSTPAGASVFIRRNVDSNGNGRPNQSNRDNNNFTSTWQVQGSSSSEVMGNYRTTLGDLLLGNNILMGGDNLFANGNDTSIRSVGNIERVDFYWSSGVTATNTDGLVVFERGAAGAHDSFNIAVFTSWDSVNNRPTTFGGSVLTVSPSAYGSTNLDWDPITAGVQSNIADYRILRFQNGDDLTNLQDDANYNNQGIAGTFISFASLGIASGTTIYGYSIMGADVTTNISNLADWNNVTYYPVTTPDTSGGIDLVSFNGRVARPVPEPATYGAILMGLALVSVFALRTRVAK
jgi:hypothetical protein